MYVFLIMNSHQCIIEFKDLDTDFNNFNYLEEHNALPKMQCMLKYVECITQSKGASHYKGEFGWGFMLESMATRPYICTYMYKVITPFKE